MNIKTVFPQALGCKIVSALSLISAISVFGAVPGDEHWDNQFNWPGPGGNNGAIAVHNGLIYAGGSATVITNAPIQLWNGLQWSTLARVENLSGTLIYDMAFVGDTLYVAGDFTNVNGMAANGLAKWNGTSWSSVGFNGLATALAVDGNNLYVGGAFTNPAAGGLTATNIAWWDGSAWHALGNGLGIYSGNNFGVNVIALKNGLVYAGGFFTNSGSLLMTNLAVWDGAGWSAVGGGVNDDVFGLAFNGGNLFAAGYFTQAGSTPANYIAQWDGANWSALGSGLASGPGIRLATFRPGTARHGLRSAPVSTGWLPASSPPARIFWLVAVFCWPAASLPTDWLRGMAQTGARWARRARRTAYPPP
jgi:hypothetical protein